MGPRFYSIHFYDVTRIKVLRTTGSCVTVRHASHSHKFGISDNFVILTILSELLFFFRRGDNNLYISSPRKNKNELVEFADCTKAKTCRKLLRNNTWSVVGGEIYWHISIFILCFRRCAKFVFVSLNLVRI